MLCCDAVGWLQISGHFLLCIQPHFYSLKLAMRSESGPRESVSYPFIFFSKQLSPLGGLGRQTLSVVLTRFILLWGFLWKKVGRGPPGCSHLFGAAPRREGTLSFSYFAGAEMRHLSLEARSVDIVSNWPVPFGSRDIPNGD